MASSFLGPEVGELETQLAQCTGAQHCITVASGTDALLISLMTLGIKPGHYPVPLYRQSAYAHDISLPVTEQAAREVVSVPMHADLDHKTQETIADALNNL